MKEAQGQLSLFNLHFLSREAAVRNDRGTKRGREERVLVDGEV
jgi:hypothetical protein